jgi:6-phosphofructokinase 1
MNATVRAAVRSAAGRGLEVFGVRRGYAGLLAGEFQPLGRRDVANVIQRGGTVLGTSRCPDFRTAEGRSQAAAALRAARIDGLIVIGGDGTFRGATHLADEHGVPIAGVPATIDNDVCGTDYTVGFDTAVNSALEAIDRIRDTAASHERLFLIEVMGRTCADIAAAVGVAGGAEDVLVPHLATDLRSMGEGLRRSWERGKRSSIVIVAEGAEQGTALRVADWLRQTSGLEARVCVLGHIQRGGSPTARDRILGSRLGAAAVDILLEGAGAMAGELGGRIVRVPLRDTWSCQREAPSELLALVHALA